PTRHRGPSQISIGSRDYADPSREARAVMKLSPSLAKVARLMRSRSGIVGSASAILIVVHTATFAQTPSAESCASLARQQLPSTKITTAEAISTGSFTAAGSTNAILPAGVLLAFKSPYLANRYIICTLFVRYDELIDLRCVYAGTTAFSRPTPRL